MSQLPALMNGFLLYGLCQYGVNVCLRIYKNEKQLDVTRQLDLKSLTQYVEIVISVLQE